MSKFEDEMKARYWEMRHRRDPIAQQLLELKEKRDALLAQYEPAVKELEQEIKALNESSHLYEMDMEISGVLKALGGKPGRDPSLPEPEPEAETPAA